MAFIAKQLVSKQLDTVKDKLSAVVPVGSEDKAQDTAANQTASVTVDAEMEAAMREEEERRREKHDCIEQERENIRQAIRDKVDVSLFSLISSQFFISQALSPSHKGPIKLFPTGLPTHHPVRLCLQLNAA
ncbi:complexin 1 [Cichlidogyrus casuarinus]|uniref:Complexin 1 n=1 Tax=Cichlidogyrus casuarinus TaxID=1844966 RepID=A0ABD2Q1L2_9PLAT